MLFCMAEAQEGGFHFLQNTDENLFFLCNRLISSSNIYTSDLGRSRITNESRGTKKCQELDVLREVCETLEHISKIK